MLRRNSLLLLFFALCFFSCSSTQNIQTANNNLSFEITLPSSLSSEQLDGRLLLLIANNDEKEPRFQLFHIL